MTLSAIFATVTTVAGIAAATVAVWHGSIDGQSYVGFLFAALGLGAGAGIHAAGVKSATPPSSAAGSGGGS